MNYVMTSLVVANVAVIQAQVFGFIEPLSAERNFGAALIGLGAGAYLVAAWIAKMENKG